MKKLFLLPILMLGMFISAQDTGFKAGAHIGFPIGDAADVSTFNLGLDASYMFYEPVDKLKIGAASGYTHFIGKTVETYELIPSGLLKKEIKKDFGFIPIAVAGEYYFNENFYVGTDLGFAIGTGDYDSGFYFQPKAGINLDKFQAFFSIKGISSNSTLTTVGIGGAYKF